MARLLQRLGHFVARNKGKVLFSWILLIVVLAGSAATWSGTTSKDFKLPGQESTIALDLMEKKFGSSSNSASAQITFEVKGAGAIVDPANLAYVKRELQQFKNLSGVIAVTDPFLKTAPSISPDKKMAFANVIYGVSQNSITAVQHSALVDLVTAATTSNISVGASGSATQAIGADVSKLGELIGLVVALIVLLLTFGSLAAAGMNLFTAMVGVGIGTTGISLATGFISLSSTTPILASMLGLAVGIDYALFIVARFRNELLRTRDVEKSVGIAVGTAGSAVLTAGFTVILALAGLSVVGIQFLTQMGIAAALTIAVAVICSLTLVPAVLAIFGVRVLSKKQRVAAATSEKLSLEDLPRPFFDKWVNALVKSPIKTVATVLALLITISIPFFSMQTSLVQTPSNGSIQAVAENAMARHFGPGFNGPLVVLVDGANAESVAFANFDAIKSTKDVQMVMPPTFNADKTAATITVIPMSGPSTLQTTALVSTLREKVVSEGSTKVYITGSTAVSVDIAKKLNGALPIYLTLVGGLALVLLIMVFRSIWVPVVGVLGFLLTIGSALGSTVAVFQWGWLSKILGINNTSPIMSITPIIVIGILFGLAMDYQVFLVSRMHEAQSHGDDPITAIKHGFHNAAPVVLAAATIMFSVFAGFFPGGDAVIKSIAFALAVGVFVDAVIVRMMLVPAALTLLGKRAWAFPRFLGWLPALDVEGHGIEREVELAS